jgi:hypothetical protein
VLSGKTTTLALLAATDRMVLALAAARPMLVALTLPHALLFALAAARPMLVALALAHALLFALAPPRPLLSLSMARARSFVPTRLASPVFTAFAAHSAHRLAMPSLTLGLSMGPGATGTAATAHSLRRSNAHPSGERRRRTRRQKRVPDGLPHT